MLIKKPKAKQFDYTPRYYNPETDIEEKRKRRLGFNSARRARGRKKSPIFWLLALVIVLYLYLRFRGYL